MKLLDAIIRTGKHSRIMEGATVMRKLSVYRKITNRAVQESGTIISAEMRQEISWMSV